VAFLWEAEGEIVAILMPDGAPVEAHLLVHPAWQTPELEEEMLDVAEARLARALPDGGRKLLVWCADEFTQRQAMLARRGYQKEDWPENQWRRDLDGPIPEAPLPPGYSMRALGEGLELLERLYASGLGFHDGDIQVAVQNRQDAGWYRNIQRCPLYRRDLDLVVFGPEGDIAAFCTIWFDDVTRSACFEPVATVPAHQRRGLARAVMTEGLRRLQRLGCTRAFVGGYSEAANALYSSVLSPEHDLDEPWTKTWS
jgi:GNAT superfamily N-acetyltransferase